jgi:lysophospholipase L1-like esterase
MSTSHIHGSIGLILVISLAAAVHADPIVLTIGDSTVAAQNINGAARGWGQILPSRFVAPGAGGPGFINQAANGASSKSFYDLPDPTSRWETALTSGANYVMIQFGTNDVQVSKPELYTNPATTYRDYLRLYVNEARAAGMNPILVTPVTQRYYKANGEIDNKLRPYALGMIAVADELAVPLIDLNALSEALYNQLGKTQTEALFVVKTDGSIDTTHFNTFGVEKIVDLIVQVLPVASPTLGNYLLVPEPASASTVVLLLVGALLRRKRDPA